MSSLDSKYAFRSEMVDRLVTDLYGPDAEDEVLTERPLDRYVTGILWPVSEDVQEDVPDDAEPAAAGDDVIDSAVAASRMTYPSSIGLTFTVDASRADEVTLTAAAARYTPVDFPNETPSERWVRKASVLSPLSVEIHTPRTIQHLLADGELALHVIIRPQGAGTITITASLRNRLPKPASGDKDLACWFQVGLTASTRQPAFRDRQVLHEVLSEDQDLASAQLLYRNAWSFAAGHGCAATWRESDVQDGLCSRVQSTFLPRQEVHRATTGDTQADLRFSQLSRGTASDIADNLETLVADYRQWISDKGEGLDAPASPGEAVRPYLRPIAERHLESAFTAAERMQAGIDLLQSDPTALRAFRLANQAMHLQRSRQDWVRDKNPNRGLFSLDPKQSWRPFQMAFILINLPSLTRLDHPERDTADLLWFPTGGGKTEAYLGLIAYMIILRRLRDPGAKGVAAIMRYTLRLLTIQQFERSAMLICSLETLRTQNPDLGSEAFSIGLWVGSAVTPNNTDNARSALRKLQNGQEVIEGNPVQLTACPWCGRTLTWEDYSVVKKPTPRMEIRCSSATCDFSSGLPVHLVDTDIYRERPELVIATVDKFAQMAWNGEIRGIFGRTSSSDYGPDLIIQDELHLISGPLGSTVGLYESAFDLAASDFLRDGWADSKRRPKVIASTATIRRAEKQIEAVFDRDSKLFPPPGLDPDDSFFSKKASSVALGTREYVGVLASGTSHATLMVRVYASLLNSGSAIPGASDDRDPYWTLIGYFNSLRVLGSACLQVSDDVQARLGLLAARNASESKPRKVTYSELTSRVPSSQIPGNLKNLETPFPDAEDVVLATNMISVGLDVDRLGLMAVMGQPQSSAEYIQATSRVGRKWPGVVVTIFNASKSRDRSHFEGFVPFHQAMYRAVEATSATPFAARARDRALHGVLVSATRMVVGSMSVNESASAIAKHEERIEKVLSAIVSRASKVAPQDADAVEKELENLREVWAHEAGDKASLRFEDQQNNANALLIRYTKALENEDFDFGIDHAPWATPESMRDVDAVTPLRQVPPRRTEKSNV